MIVARRPCLNHSRCRCCGYGIVRNINSVAHYTTPLVRVSWCGEKCPSQTSVDTSTVPRFFTVFLSPSYQMLVSRLRLKCDGTRAESRFRLSGKRTSPFKATGASVQSTAGSRGVRISSSNGSNAGYTMFRGSV
jgi:hypothetical protein